MDDKKANFRRCVTQREGCPANLVPALEFLKQIPHTLQNSLKSHFKHSAKRKVEFDTSKPLAWMERESSNGLDVNLDKQLQAWKENPNWVDQPPKIRVSIPKGSLCNLKVKFKVGLPPDAIYNIVIDPDNKRVFKNVKEVISRRVLVDEGHRQVVEVEQAAIWRFLWWSGTISVHVFVDQNRKDHTVKFKQGKSGFMEKFEGCWKVEPLFVDELYCSPLKPRSWAEYDSCTRGKGRIGSIVSLEQLIQPALVPPPPISWYLRGITARTTEMLINDLLAEAARLRGAVSNGDSSSKLLESSFDPTGLDHSPYSFDDNIKERWRQRRGTRRQRNWLKRTGKSCRLRWLNYLRPDVRRGNITPEEQLLIMELHSRWGNRWSKIARQLPGRTDNEIKNYWRTRIQKKTKQGESYEYQNQMEMVADDASTSHSTGMEDCSGSQQNYSMHTNANITDAFSAPSYSNTDSAENFWNVEDFWSMQPLNGAGD